MSGCGCPLTAEMTGGHPSEQQTCQPAVPSAVMASLCIWQRKKGGDRIETRIRAGRKSMAQQMQSLL